MRRGRVALAFVLLAFLGSACATYTAQERLARNPHPKFFVTVRVALARPLLIGGPEDVVHAYEQSFGVVAPRAQVEALVEAEVRDGRVDWARSTVEEIDPKTLGPEVSGLIDPPQGAGVWYRSGRVLRDD